MGTFFTGHKTFRFDDVSINTDWRELSNICSYLSVQKGYKLILGVSPLVFKSNDGRVFPKILNAYSDHTEYYKVNGIGIEYELINSLKNHGCDIKLAGHGLVHCDHRLMDYEAQELSIVSSCSLVGASIFIPPFNKWNKHTEKACDKHNIDLVKFEDGWLSMEYNNYDPNHSLWYLHSREWTLETVKKWLNEV